MVLALSGYCVFIAVVVLNPSADLPSAVVSRCGELLGLGGAPDVMTVPYRLEFALNALMIAPLAAACSIHRPGTSWRDCTAWGFVLSGGVELFQALFLPARSASFVDVCANTLGALMGAVAVSGTQALLQVRRANAAQSAP
jgi:hypothetical protein